MPGRTSRAFLPLIVAVSLLTAACGSSGGSKGTVTIGGFNFSESSILASIYGGALKGAGYTVDYRLNLGTREIVAPALQRGEIDFYPGYAATELEYFDNAAGLATANAAETTARLNQHLQAKQLKALDPAPALDTNAFAVLKQGHYGGYSKLSQLGPVAGQMTLGGPPECPQRPFCQLGLAKVYGLHFKDFKALDSGGPLTKAALDRGDIDLGLIFSSDSAYSTGKYVKLQDDRHLQNADNVVPVGRSQILTSEVASILNPVSAKLTTEALIEMNRKSDVDKEDPDQIASEWLKSNGFAS
jgi:osmoprotectant transport system substrate-binding protein